MGVRGATVPWWGVSVLALAGLGIATYLSVSYLSGHAPACGPSGGCGRVTTSPYALFLGVPVALLGVAMYAALVLGGLAAAALHAPPGSLRYAMLLVAAAGVGGSAYLTHAEVAVLHAICAYCVASAVLITLIFALMAFTVVGRVGYGTGRHPARGGP